MVTNEFYSPIASLDSEFIDIDIQQAAVGVEHILPACTGIKYRQVSTLAKNIQALVDVDRKRLAVGNG